MGWKQEGDKETTEPIQDVVVEHQSRLAFDTFVRLTMPFEMGERVDGNRNSEIKFLLVMH